jgi:hypothetical protein
MDHKVISIRSSDKHFGVNPCECFKTQPKYHFHIATPHSQTLTHLHMQTKYCPRIVSSV